VFDLAGSLPPGRFERALDNALAYKLTTLAEVRDVAAQLCRRGRTGSRLMRELLAARGADFRPVESGLEALLLAALLDGGLPEPDRQVDLGGAGWVGRVDLYYRDARLVVEVDSERHHTAVLDAAADGRRDAELRAAGFEVLRVTEAVLRQDPGAAVEAVRRALAASTAA
jgi:very-short-patch-repair endonuclease